MENYASDGDESKSTVNILNDDVFFHNCCARISYSRLFAFGADANDRYAY